MIKKIIPIITIISLSLFILTDFEYIKVITEAVSLKQGLYGESYGPTSFFRPILFYLSMLLSITTSILLLKK